MIPGLTQCPRRRSSSRQQQQQQPELPRSSRSSSSSSSSGHHLHHHHHHHHHHHYYQQQSSHRPRVTRTQIADLEQASFADPFPQPSSSEAASSAGAPSSDADQFLRARMPLIAQRRSEPTEAHRAAVEARGRLDERLREAAFLGRRNQDQSLPMLAHQYFNALFSENEAEHLVWEEEHEWEASFSEWITGRVPGLRESWTNELPSRAGLSKAAIGALPREVFHSKSKQHQEDELVDCSVCLEQFRAGESLVRLPCKHKFHPACITPWLETHEQCPYCRAKITAASSSSSRRSELENEDNLLSWLEAFETGMSRRFSLNS